MVYGLNLQKCYIKTEVSITTQVVDLFPILISVLPHQGYDVYTSFVANKKGKKNNNNVSIHMIKSLKI